MRNGESTRTKLESLTGLRAIAALAVFAVHLPQFGGRVEPLTFHLTRQGATGVTFFYLLSGFVLMWSLRPRSYWSFARSRLARIYPAYLAAACLGVIVTAHLDPDSLSLSTAVPMFLLLQSWVPNPDYYFAVNGVSWSLSCEIFFYAVFPLYALHLANASIRSRRGMQVALVLAVIALGCLEAASPSTFTTWLNNYFPLTRNLEFVFGATLALDVKERRIPQVPLLFAAVASVVAYGVAGIAPSALAARAIPILPFSLLLVAAASADLTGRRSPFRSKTLVWLGTLSYSFYLVHQLIIKEISELTNAYGVLIFGLPLAIAAAAGLYRWVEVPGNRRWSTAPGTRP